jgi:peptidoglycan/LPS O-acetylase OafA/YrhL
LQRATSTYLDLLRFLAAATVFLSHAGTRQFSGGLLWQFTYYGHEAVVVFFVLSGFVIAAVTEQRESRLADYAVNRVARIASVAWPALLIGFALDALGRLAAPELYAGWPLQPDMPIGWQVAAPALFVNELWTWHIVPGSNLPYWSMGFEVWFYAAFAALAFAPPRWRICATVAVLALAGPRIALLFPVWLLGVGAWRLSRYRLVSAPAGLILWLAASVLLLMVESLHLPRDMMYGHLVPTAARLLDYPHYLGLGALVALGLVGFDAAAATALARIARWQAPIRWLAGGTFALYLLHVPLMQFAVAAAPWSADSWPTRALVFFGVPVVAYLLAELTERRKSFWRGLACRLLGMSGRGGTPRGGILVAPGEPGRG